MMEKLEKRKTDVERGRNRIPSMFVEIDKNSVYQFKNFVKKEKKKIQISRSKNITKIAEKKGKNSKLKNSKQNTNYLNELKIKGVDFEDHPYEKNCLGLCEYFENLSNETYDTLGKKSILIKNFKEKKLLQEVANLETQAANLESNIQTGMEKLQSIVKKEKEKSLDISHIAEETLNFPSKKIFENLIEKNQNTKKLQEKIKILETERNRLREENLKSKRKLKKIHADKLVKII